MMVLGQIVAHPKGGVNMRKLTLCLLFVLIFSTSAIAVDGYVEVSYDLLHEQGKAAIELWEDFDNIRLGIKGQSDLHFTLKGGYIPAGAPLNQSYKGYITYFVTDDISFTFASHCNHWFAQSQRSYKYDTGGLTLSTRYEF